MHRAGILASVSPRKSREGLRVLSELHVPPRRGVALFVAGHPRWSPAAMRQRWTTAHQNIAGLHAVRRCSARYAKPMVNPALCTRGFNDYIAFSRAGPDCATAGCPPYGRPQPPPSLWRLGRIPTSLGRSGTSPAATIPRDHRTCRFIVNVSRLFTIQHRYSDVHVTITRTVPPH